MLKALGSFLTKLVGKSGATILTGAGLSIASYAAITTAATTALTVAVNSFSGLGSDLANIVLLCGVGQSISILGAAILTRAAIQSANLGLTKTL